MTIEEQGVRNPLVAMLELTGEEKLARGVLHTPIEIVQQPVTWENTFARVTSQSAELRRFLDRKSTRLNSSH